MKKTAVFVIIITLFAIILIGAVSILKRFSSSSKAIITALASDSSAKRKWAKEQLKKHKFTHYDLSMICDAIKKDYPDDKDSFSSTRSSLFRLLWDLNDKDTPHFIREIYPHLPDNADILFSCLRVLSQMNTRESIEILIEILIKNQPDLKYSCYTLFIPFERDTKNARYLFPELFKLLENNNYKYILYCLALQCCDEKAIEGSVFKDYRSQVISDWKDAVMKRDGALKGSEEFKKADDLIAVIADFSNNFPHDGEIKSMLENSLHDSAPKVTLCATKSLLRLGENVPDLVLETLASSPETRLYIYEELCDLRLSYRFPKKHHNQPSFAEANMVRWLCSPFEFGRPPDKIELISTKEVNIDNEEGRVYLFKFFYNDDNDGWMVGLSGPQPIDIQKAETSGHLTFSHFKKLDSMTIEDHFASFLK